MNFLFDDCNPEALGTSTHHGHRTQIPEEEQEQIAEDTHTHLWDTVNPLQFIGNHRML